MGNAILLDVVVRDAPSSRADSELIEESGFLAKELGLGVRITSAPGT